MDVLTGNAGVFASGFFVTFQIVLLAAVGALVLGTLVAAMRISPLPPLRWLGTAYVTVVRNTPLTIVFFMTAFGLPEIGVDAGFLRIPLLDSLFTRLGTDVPYFRFAIVALTVYTAAFVCEALRAGVNAVQPGQSEAGRSLGLTFTQNLRLIVLPQAGRATVVPLGSVIIAMIKNSALAGAFGVAGDLFQTSDELTSAQGLPAIPVFIGVAAGYLILTVPLGLLLDRIERSQAVTR
ncbi:MAG: amino acid transporter permease [Actinomycetia bacterium]|jgi:glutamate transport system permease protein|nr:amino acid transporter permease [Actinomycetes bacterium]MDQ1656118.1 glutamate transport system permease protein [Cryptosporangiaceae bacterium]